MTLPKNIQRVEDDVLAKGGGADEGVRRGGRKEQWGGKGRKLMEVDQRRKRWNTGRRVRSGRRRRKKKWSGKEGRKSVEGCDAKGWGKSGERRGGPEGGGWGRDKKKKTDKERRGWGSGQEGGIGQEREEE